MPRKPPLASLTVSPFLRFPFSVCGEAQKKRHTPRTCSLSQAKAEPAWTVSIRKAEEAIIEPAPYMRPKENAKRSGAPLVRGIMEESQSPLQRRKTSSRARVSRGK